MSRFATTLVLVIVALVDLYLGAAIVGGAIPANRGWRPAEQGIRVYVVDNGIHTDLVLPVVGGGTDWRSLARAEHLADPRYAANSHVMFGWGNRDFYLNTPHWSDLNPIVAAKALVGRGPTVVHVSHIPEPQPGDDVKALTLSPDAYRRLTYYVRATFGEGPPVHGYGPDDAFYVARGGYSGARTCNEWTAGALRAAGVKMSIWAPFPFGVMQWL